LLERYPHSHSAAIEVCSTEPVHFLDLENVNIGRSVMDRVDAPLERRYYTTENRGEAEAYVAAARGFQSVEEMRAFFAARETRNSVPSLERRLVMLEIGSV
jgi:hypothetical protein